MMKRSIPELLNDKELMERAMAEAVQEALLDHKRAGNPIPAWRNNQVVWIQPEDIPENILDKSGKNKP